MVKPFDDEIHLLFFLLHLVVRHFINPQSEIRGVHECLGVTQDCDRRRFEIGQRPLKFRQADGVFARAICDDGDRGFQVGNE